MLPRAALCLCIAALAGCATAPKPTDQVQTAEQAIAIAQKACSGSSSDHWTAEFRFGLWEVEHVFVNAPASCNTLRTQVFPDTGKSRPCEECVVVT